jgi:hypothetical protein
MIRKLLLSLLEINSKDITGETGKRCYTSGVYRACDEYIPLSKGETFPPAAGKSVVWSLVVTL